MELQFGLSVAALACFLAGALSAILGIWFERLRSGLYQLVAAGAGMVLKTAAIGLSCTYSQTHYFNSPAETASLLAWALVCSYLLALVVSGVRSLGAVVLPLVVLLQVLALVLDIAGPEMMVPASRLMAVHVLAAFLGYGLFLTACGASVLYLEQARLLKRKAFGALFHDLPSLEQLDRLALLCAVLGFALFSVAIAAGAVLERRVPQAVAFSPKIWAAYLTWLVFAVLIAGRLCRRLQGRAAAKLILAGAVLVLLTFFCTHPFVLAGTDPVRAATGEARNG